MNKGGAAGYIAKYIVKNIDGYARDGEIDHDTGKPLRDMVAAVTAWASTWRIPQFKSLGVPTMSAYRECVLITYAGLAWLRRLTNESKRFLPVTLRRTLPGRGQTPRDVQTVRVARKVADELNAYDEEVQKVVGIFAPHLGAGHVFETRTTEWRIVRKAVDVEPLTLKSASGAPRSPVNNCGEVEQEPEPIMQATPPEYVTAVMKWKLVGVIRTSLRR